VCLKKADDTFATCDKVHTIEFLQNSAEITFYSRTVEVCEQRTESGVPVTDCNTESARNLMKSVGYEGEHIQTMIDFHTSHGLLPALMRTRKDKYAVAFLQYLGCFAYFHQTHPYAHTSACANLYINDFPTLGAYKKSSIDPLKPRG